MISLIPNKNPLFNDLDAKSTYDRVLSKTTLLLKHQRTGASLSELEKLKNYLLNRGLHTIASEIAEKASEICLLARDFASARSLAAEAYDLYQGIPDPRAVLVEQNEYMISKAHPLGTSSVGECIAIAAYHRATKTIGLAHIDHLTSQKSIAYFLSQMPKGSLEITLIGGSSINAEKNHISKTNFEKINAIFAEKKDIQVHNRALSIAHPTTFVVDLNGEIHDHKLPTQNTETRYIRSGLANFTSSIRDLRKSYEEDESGVLIPLPTDLPEEVQQNLKPYQALSEETITQIYAKKNPISGLITASEILALRSIFSS